MKYSGQTIKTNLDNEIVEKLQELNALNKDDLKKDDSSNLLNYVDYSHDDDEGYLTIYLNDYERALKPFSLNLVDYVHSIVKNGNLYFLKGVFATLYLVKDTLEVFNLTDEEIHHETVQIDSIDNRVRHCYKIFVEDGYHRMGSSVLPPLPVLTIDKYYHDNLTTNIMTMISLANYTEFHARFFSFYFQTNKGVCEVTFDGDHLGMLEELNLAYLFERVAKATEPTEELEKVRNEIIMDEIPRLTIYTKEL